jgi:hypothetical protein
VPKQFFMDNGVPPRKGDRAPVIGASHHTTAKPYTALRAVLRSIFTGGLPVRLNRKDVSKR